MLIQSTIVAAVEIAAVVAVVLLGVFTAIQLAVAFGAPWGAVAWGVEHTGVRTAKQRIAAGISVVTVYPMMALTILAAADMAEGDWLPVSDTLVMWLLTVGFTAVAVFSALSQTKPERIWAPFWAVIAVCFGVVTYAM